MSSFRTFFRVVVMLATLALVAKVWYHFGPTMAELRAIGGRVAQAAGQAWDNYWQGSEAGAPLATDDQRSTMATPPAPFVPPTGPVAPTRLPPPTRRYESSPVRLAGNETLTPDPNPTAISPPEPTAIEPPNDPLQEAMDRLRSLGARDEELAPWGGRGELVRFTCSVPWGNSPNFTRQFEAVATTPLAALEQVAAEIEAWNTSR